MGSLGLLPTHQTLTRFTVCQLGLAGLTLAASPGPVFVQGVQCQGERGGVWFCGYCLFPRVTLGKGLSSFFPFSHLHIGNNSTYLKRGCADELIWDNLVTLL